MTFKISQRFFDKFETSESEDGMINQEEFMKALAEEKNLIDILTQNGRYYEGMDLWKYSILFNWHSCSMLIHCNFIESINKVLRYEGRIHSVFFYFLRQLQKKTAFTIAVAIA